MNSDERLLDEAISQSARCLVEPKLGPFGAVIARNGEIIGIGANLVAAEFDPTAHAEIVAIREACRNAGTTDLSDCVLYASTEPCPMCSAAAHFAGLRTAHVASGNAELAPAVAQIGLDLWAEHAGLVAVATGNWDGAGWTIVRHEREREKATQVLAQWVAMTTATMLDSKG